MPNLTFISPRRDHDQHDGPTRRALIVSIVDRAKHDRRFRAELRQAPEATLAELGLRLRDSEWAGLGPTLLD